MGTRCLKFVVVLGRIELPATRLGGGCSIQLSYRTTDGLLLPFFACPVKACRFLSRKKPPARQAMRSRAGRGSADSAAGPSAPWHAAENFSGAKRRRLPRSRRLLAPAMHQAGYRRQAGEQEGKETGLCHGGIGVPRLLPCPYPQQQAPLRPAPRGGPSRPAQARALLSPRR